MPVPDNHDDWEDWWSGRRPETPMPRVEYKPPWGSWSSIFRKDTPNEENQRKLDEGILPIAYDLIVGKKPRKPPSTIQDAEEDTRTNAEITQEYVKKLREHLDNYIEKHPEYRDEISDNYDRQLAVLQRRMPHDKQMHNLAYKQHRRYLDEIEKAGSREEQALAALNARKELQGQISDAQDGRELQAAQSGLYGRQSGISPVSEALAKASVSNQARLAEQRRGDEMLAGSLPYLEEMRHAPIANLDAQNMAHQNKLDLEKGLYSNLLNSASGLSGYIDGANSNWNSAFNAANANWQAQMNYDQARKNQRNNQIGNYIGIANNLFGNDGLFGNFGGSKYPNYGPPGTSGGGGNILTNIIKPIAGGIGKFIGGLF